MFQVKGNRGVRKNERKHISFLPWLCVVGFDLCGDLHLKEMVVFVKLFFAMIRLDCDNLCR